LRPAADVHAFRLRGLTLKNRVVVSPMAQYSRRRRPGDYHLVHLGARAMGGAALVLAEMTCTSPTRASPPAAPACGRRTGAAWRRIVDWVHANSDANIGMQIGHAGPKGSTNAPWPGTVPTSRCRAATGRCWSASPSPICPTAPVPRAMTRADMDRVTADFVAATRRAAAPASTGWNCTARTATCCRASSRR
jgi:anthraniloyl-CoA monooxygenase